MMLGFVSAVALSTGAARAQTADEPVSTRQPVSSEEIVVQGQIAYRNRTDTIAPVLDYGLDYFQRFEPLTVGDALKRVPSVSFLSDVLESDGVRLRGLDPAYTQILINGERVPGSGDSSGAFGNGADGAFFVDRIPAELIERVEIVRSPSANRSGDAVAGAINIVLRNAFTLDGGYLRAGALYFPNDETWGKTIGGVWGGAIGAGRLMVGANVQDRHNPKDKLSLRYGSPADTTLDNSEVQTDVRDGTDYSGNFSWIAPFQGGEFKLDGFFVRTERTQDEDSIEYNLGVVAPANITTVNDNDVDIEQESYSLTGGYKLPLLGGETSVKFGYARFINDAFEFEEETEYLRDANPYPEGDRFTRDASYTDLDDREISAKLEHKTDLGDLAKLEFGVQYESKERKNLVSEIPRIRFNLANGSNTPNARPAASLIPADGPAAPVAGGDNTITRKRLDPYAMLSGKAGAFEWEAGLRYETTDVKVIDRTTLTATNASSEELLPSAHLKWNLTEADRILASAARTVRYPSFAFLSPATLEEELGENDFDGNPDLKPETAWGFDLGYERRIGTTGIAGVNVFYRDVRDLIEIYNTGAPGSIGEPGRFVYSARNTGEGQVWGVEFDVSAPLSFVGMDNTGVFLNYSLLESDVDDEFGSRAFNSQAESVLNVGFIQDLPAWNSSFGVTYRKQGDAESRIVGEEVTTSYGADLEAFVEHRIGERFTVRLTGSNLLDESKDEAFNKFLDAADQRGRAFDEYELETETAGPVFQLVGRYAF